MSRPFDPASASARAFDAYVFIDWSAANRPKRGPDSIWFAAGRIEDGHLREDAPLNCGTRDEAEERLGAFLIERSARGERTLLGWDFPLGYPRELAALLGVAGARGIWELLARELRDQGNRSNRFDVAAALNARLKSACSSGGPFWGCPARQARDGLTERKPPPAALPEWRLCELALREKGRRPHAVWKLYTAGSCGSQTLTGIPRLLRLRDAPALAAASAIWPFETGFALPAASRIVHVECWPGAVPFQSGAHEVKDAAQMLSLLRWAARLDGKGELAARFGPLGGLSGAQLSRAREEGWILW